MVAFDPIGCVVHAYTDRWGVPTRITVQVGDGPEREIPQIAEARAHLKAGDIPTVELTLVARLVVHDPDEETAS